MIGLSLFLAGCNADQQTANVAPYADANTNTDANLAELEYEEYDHVAKDNLNLQRVGDLLQRSRTPQEFETYLNEPDGINNLDLNGDGYVDYISVDEYYDPAYDNQRGLTMYTRWGPDEVQELGTVVFYRDEPRMPGARILLTGDEIIYGNNYYYEANWVDKALAIANLLFGNHTVYRSPYYYDRYPPGYAVYEVVETPVYVTRIERLYPDPFFVFAASPTVVSIQEIRIESPYKDKWYDRIYAQLVNPRPEQIEFKKMNPGRPVVPPGQLRRPDVPPGQAKRPDVPPGQQKRPDVPPGQAKQPGDDRGKGKPDDRGKGGDKGKPNDRGNPNKPQGGPPGKGKKP